MCTLLDPRVNYVLKVSKSEVDRLLELVEIYSVKAHVDSANENSDEDSEDDMFTIKSPVASAPTQLDADIQYFKIHLLRSIRTKLLSNINGVKTYDYFGGVGRQEDINVYQFYQHHGSKMPELNAIISQLLG